MPYTPYSIDPHQLEEAVKTYRNNCLHEKLKTVAAAEAKMEGVDEAVSAIIDMFHCSNYEADVKQTAAYRKGWADAVRSIGRAFVPTIVLDDILDGIEMPKHDTDIQASRTKAITDALLEERAVALADKVKKLLESKK